MNSNGMKGAALQWQKRFPQAQRRAAKHLRSFLLKDAADAVMPRAAVMTGQEESKEVGGDRKLLWQKSWPLCMSCQCSH